MGKRIRTSVSTFIKENKSDCIIIALGVLLSTFLGIAFNTKGILIGVIATFFVEMSLLTIRIEIKKQLSELLEKQLLQVLNRLYRASVVKEGISVSELAIKHRKALDIEIDRLDEAIGDLLDGKRRIYDKDELYDEQVNIICEAKSSIITIHIVNDLRNLYQWDPEKMDKNSKFYSKLYKSFEDEQIKAIPDKRRLIVLPGVTLQKIKSISGVVEDAEKRVILKKKDVHNCTEKELSVLYSDSIERIANDQKRLEFEVRFIQDGAALRAGLDKIPHDCIIRDRKYGLEFAKAKKSLDVRAYVIDSEKYIQEQCNSFETLWNASEKWG